MNSIPRGRLLWGALEIGREARIFKKKNGKIVIDENGDPVVDIDKVYYRASKGLLDVSRNGRILVSTDERIHESALNPLNKVAAA
jgi:hypothetical protein